MKHEHTNMDVINQKTILERPRLQNILKDSILIPVVVITAGPLQGKTTAVVNFTKHINKPVIWVTFSILDNDLFTFWNTVCCAFEASMPELAPKLRAIEEPWNSAGRNDFFVIINQELSEKGIYPLLILDNVDCIENEKIRNFILTATKVNVERQYFCIMILCQKKMFIKGYTPPLLDTNIHPFVITDKDLAFTPKEIIELFELHDIKIDKEKSLQMYEETKGWVFLLQLMLLKTENRTVLTTEDFAIAAQTIDNRYFREYPQEIKEIFIQLSLLPFFTVGIIKDLADTNFDTIMQIINENIFIDYNYFTKQYLFYPIYRRFLMDKLEYLAITTINDTLNSAGHFYMMNGLYQEALQVYYDAKNYTDCIKAILSFESYTVEQTHDILEMLYQIPDNIKDENPWIRFCIAYFYLINLRITKAKKLLFEIVDTYEGKDTQRLLLGEVYILLTYISFFERTMDGLEYIKKATYYLPKGTALLNNHMMFLSQNDLFFLPDDSTVSIDQMISYIHSLSPYFEKITDGNEYGMELLFEAEASYYRGDFITVINKASQAIHKGKYMKQYEVVSNSYYLLVKTAIFLSDYDGFVYHLKNASTYLKNHQQHDLLNFNYRMEEYFAVNADAIKKDVLLMKAKKKNIYVQKPLWIGRNLLFDAMYWMTCDKYLEALRVISELEYVLTKRKLWAVRVSSYILKCIALFNLGDTEAALDNLYEAYKITTPHKIIVLYVEFGVMILPVLQYIRNNAYDRFDEEWIHLILREASSYRQNSEKILNAYKIEKNKSLAPDYHFSPREKTALHYLVRGFTREEIAKEMEISINGVKKHLSNIYDKLGARNRSEAIFIATSNNFTK